MKGSPLRSTFYNKLIHSLSDQCCLMHSNTPFVSKVWCNSLSNHSRLSLTDSWFNLICLFLLVVTACTLTSTTITIYISKTDPDWTIRHTATRLSLLLNGALRSWPDGRLLWQRLLSCLRGVMEHLFHWSMVLTFVAVLAPSFEAVPD